MTTNTKQKEIERADLHKTIWNIANELRGSVDGWDFKSYVLGMLFYRFISENLTDFINKQTRSSRINNDSFDYVNMSDDDAIKGKESIIKFKGFFMKPSQLFSNVLKYAREDKSNLNEILDKVFKDIEASAANTSSANDFKGLFDDVDVNSKKLGATVDQRNTKLLKLLEAINGLELSYADNTIDAFGDAYEYLMNMYASSAGKSGGEFFTPQEVSELLAKLVIGNRTEVKKVYDPACWSGSLLLKFAKVLGKSNIGGFYGQEINITTYNLCRINMFLHNISFEKFDIKHWDTLVHPDPEHNQAGQFDAIVSNPPYSIRWEGSDNAVLKDDVRFKSAWVLAPKSKADLAFTMHMLHLLSNDGTAAVVEFPWVLYRSGAEEKIRQYLIKYNFVDTVIQLPSDLFYGTSIATCIFILKKNRQDNNILFIDASKEFVKEGKNNKLTLDNQNHILDVFLNRKEEQYFSALVDKEKVLENNSNLSVSSYVEPKNEKLWNWYSYCSKYVSYLIWCNYSEYSLGW